MSDVMRHQYDLIRSVRQHLFSFMEEMPLEKLHEKVPGFGIGRMIEAHIHAADSYRYWLGSFAFQQEPSEYEDTPEGVIEKADVKKVREIFDSVDEIVERFLGCYQSSWMEEIESKVDWREEPLRLTPLFLLSHVETHEFHHKGQIVAMARHLGYNPPADERLGALFS